MSLAFGFALTFGPKAGQGGAVFPAGPDLQLVVFDEDDQLGALGDDDLFTHHGHVIGLGIGGKLDIIVVGGAEELEPTEEVAADLLDVLPAHEVGVLDDLAGGSSLQFQDGPVGLCVLVNRPVRVIADFDVVGLP